MMSTESKIPATEITIEQWLSIRKEAGLTIAPETAEVDWSFGQPSDPYGIIPDFPEEQCQVGRVYFARSPNGDIWVAFCDLPAITRNALWPKHERQLAFPAGPLQDPDDPFPF
jgi:hypothetical protein